MEWNDRQLDAIKDTQHNLLVAAAAGSGKTAVLVERVTRLVLEKKIGIDEMLVLTFTNAAALEMKEKIYQSLEKQLLREDLQEDEAEFLRKQLNKLSGADISTFHKFGIKIIHEFYELADLNPNLSVCDEARSTLFMEESIEELFEEKYKEKDPGFKKLLDAYSTSKKDDDAKKMVVALYNFIQSLPYPAKYLDEIQSGEAFNLDELINFAKKQIVLHLNLDAQYVKSALKFMAEYKIPLLTDKLAKELADTESLIQGFEEGNFNAAINAFKVFKRATLKSSKAEEETWNEIKEEVTSIRDLGNKHLEQIKKMISDLSLDTLKLELKYSRPILDTLCELTRGFAKKYENKKLSAGLMDYSDIEHFALKILSHAEASEEYRNKFKYIFVDEYQDSNLVQETLLQNIVRENNYFMVGDVKQSIYKFRLAEPEMFVGKYKNYKTGNDINSRVIDLNSNYRSKASIIQFVNRIFSQLMNEENGGIAYDDDAALHCGRSLDTPCTYEPKVYITDCSEGIALEGSESDELIDELRAEDLEALTAIKIIKENYHKPIYDFDTKKERLLEYKDMAVLMFSTKTMGESFYKAFLDAGIPVFLERSEGYFDALEIQVLLNLLKIIDNDKRDIPLISVLHFPSIGFDAEDLSKIRIATLKTGKSRGSFSDAFCSYASNGEDEKLKDKCASFIKKLEEYRRLSVVLPLSDFIWKLLSESGILNYAAALPNGLQRETNLRALTDKAAEYEAEYIGGLYGFISYIEAVQSKVNVGEAKIFSENENAVRIMTIHKSKGLQFPFVLLAGLGKKFPTGSDTGNIAFHKEYGIGLKLVQPEKHLVNETNILRLIRLEDKMEKMAEDIRVLYVALTRPQDMVFLSAAVKNSRALLQNAKYKMPSDIYGSTSLFDILVPALSDMEFVIENRDSLDVNFACQTKNDEHIRHVLENGFPQEDIGILSLSSEEIQNRLSFELSENVGQKRKFSVSELARMENTVKTDLQYRVPDFINPKEELNGADKGTAYHTVMEHLPFTQDGKDAESIKKFIIHLQDRGILSAKQVNAIDPAKIAAFFTSDIGRRAIASSELHKEAPFTLKEEYEGRQIMVQGTIDCYFKEDDGWVLVDYKSNYIDQKDEESAFLKLKEEYLPQLKQYKLALEKITGLPVKKAVLYLFGVEKELDIQ